MSEPKTKPSQPVDRSRGLGRIGIWSTELRFGDPVQAREATIELEELGFGAVWIPGGVGGDFLGDIDRLLASTRRIAIGSGILNIYKHDPADVGAWWPGDHARIMLGLGVSHAPLIGEAFRKPLGAMTDYLDALDAAGLPRARLCLAALGPKMLELARDRTAGAHPYLVTPGHTAFARDKMGPDALLAPEQGVILETDADRARAVARNTIAHYARLPNYVNSWLRLGFSEQDISQQTDRLVDGLFAWGSPEQIATRVAEHFTAGADHVCLQVLGDGTMTPPRTAWKRLASVLLT
jgi:probable F420-dependent oxidoreductase